MIKKLRKILIIMLIACIFVQPSVFAAGSVTVSTNSLNILEGQTASFNIVASNAAGKVSIASTNPQVATSSSSIIFVDNETVSITVTANSSGTANIVVTLADVSTYDSQELTNTYNVTVNVSKKSSNVTEPQQPSQPQNNNPVVNNTPAGKNATLSKMVLNVEGLSPSFDKDITDYTLTVGKDVSQLEFNLGMSEAGATYWIAGDGHLDTSGATTVKNLAFGQNNIRITVTSKDRSTQKTYNIVVTKAENKDQANTNLTNIIVENYELSPAFNPNTLEYSIGDLKEGTEKLNIVCFKEDDGASYTIDGLDDLSTGKISINVTAKDGITKRTYVISYKPLEKKEDNSEVEVYVYNDIVNSDSLEDVDNTHKISKSKLAIIILSIVCAVETIALACCVVVIINKNKEIDSLTGNDKKYLSSKIEDEEDDELAEDEQYEAYEVAEGEGTERARRRRGAEEENQIDESSLEEKRLNEEWLENLKNMQKNNKNDNE